MRDLVQQVALVFVLGTAGEALGDLLVDSAKDPTRDIAYVKVEAESARLISRQDRAHPAYTPKDLQGPGLDYSVFKAGKLPASVTMPRGPSGGAALFNTGTGEQDAVEETRNKVYLPHEGPPLGTIAEYRMRLRETGVYELFLRLAYWKGTQKAQEHWAAHTTSSGNGAIHVKDYEKGRPLNSDWWRRHNNGSWELSDTAWKVVDFGPALEVKTEDLNDEGYVDVVWQISASDPGLIIDSLVLYQGYQIDPKASKYAQEAAYKALPMSPAVK